VCRQLAARGWTVILTARTPDRARAAADPIADGHRLVRAKALDVGNDLSPRLLAGELAGEFGRLDVLVNNAAGGAPGPPQPLPAGAGHGLTTRHRGRMIRAATILV
jgi:NAD(P)-dependent dehydrogenase (short-subunit alcohol dehydrogenase family)